MILVFFSKWGLPGALIFLVESSFAQAPEALSDTSSKIFQTAMSGSAISQSGFSAVVPERTIIFPDDHGLHPEFKTEWWYVTANLQDDDGNQYGVQFTLFSNAEKIADKKQRVFFSHAALSTQEHFFYAERYAREDMLHAGVDIKPWKAYIDHWSFSGSGEAPLPGRLKVSEPEFGFRLSLANTDYFLQGDKGYSRKNGSGALASHYYSAPFIDVSGEIYYDDKTMSVIGKAWLDREWSSDIIGVERLGWDWLSLHLDENTALMLYRVRSNGEIHLSGVLMYKDGTQEKIAADKIKWSPRGYRTFLDKRYPVSWYLEISGKNIAFNIDPINENQFMKTLIPYWEGAVTTSGTHSATGYLELFGER